jgi:predicted Na+-dependent transporter
MSSKSSVCWAGSIPGWEQRLGSIATAAANLFPLWLVLAAGSAILHPPSLAWFKREYTTPGLALTMMAMGTTLTLEVGCARAIPH